ncbi:MAG: phage major capsid protein [Oscillospiraceae bacterium]
MNTYTEMLPYINDRTYEADLWNSLRGKATVRTGILDKGVDTSTGAFTLTPKSLDKFNSRLEKDSLFRGIATSIRAYDNQYRIKTANNQDVAAWVPEGGAVPLATGTEDFHELVLHSHKLVTFFKLEEAFVQDNTFLLEDHLVKRLTKNFGRAEDDAFINGTGEHMPTGILAENGGADVGVTTSALTYDDVIKLFFSVKPEYRRNAVWVMNDETALALRTLKDADGNYIWNHANDNILGKKVLISEYMPGVQSGSKPIAFGDFSYYWIVCRRPVCIRPLLEKYIMLGYIGYLAYEFLDGKLTRSEAIKVMRMTA